MPVVKSTILDPALVEKATQQMLALKATLTEIAATTARNTTGVKTLNKNGRPLARVARSAAVIYPEVLPGRFDAEDYDNKVTYDELTEPLMSLINDTVDTFAKKRAGNSADIEYRKRQIYFSLSNAAKDDDQYSYYAKQLAAEYEGQGKRSDNGDKGDDAPPKV